MGCEQRVDQPSGAFGKPLVEPRTFLRWLGTVRDDQLATLASGSTARPARYVGFGQYGATSSLRWLRAVRERDPDPLLERELGRTHVGTGPFHRQLHFVLVEPERLQRARRLDRAFGKGERVVRPPGDGRIRRRAGDDERPRVLCDVVTLAKAQQILLAVITSFGPRQQVVNVDVARRSAPRNAAPRVITREHPAAPRRRDIGRRARSSCRSDGSGRRRSACR